jgi:ribosome-binding factor A
MAHRMEKINELIRDLLGEILTRELTLKAGVFPTIAKVDTTKDLRYTRIFLSVYPEKEEGYVLQALRNEMFEIQGKLNKKLHIRPLPRVEFLIDKTEVEADEVEKILHQLQKEKDEK